MNSRIYRGRVWHSRKTPRPHAFSYALFMVYLDLDELDRVFAGIPGFSTGRPALAWWRRADHFGDPAQDLRQSVRDFIRSESGAACTGPIRLLTHLRYWGYCVNPVSLYYCFAPDGRHLEFLVAEVTNTPWGERHCYLIDCRGKGGVADRHAAIQDKALHVSPFMGMDQHYDWVFTTPGEALSVRITSQERGSPVFAAGLQLNASPIAARTLYATLFAFPFMTLRVVTAIYWQALRLWLKGIPFVPHPAKHKELRKLA